jgi:hypothetical protein
MGMTLTTTTTTTTKNTSLPPTRKCKKNLKKITKAQSTRNKYQHATIKQTKYLKISEAPHSMMQHNTHPNTEDFFEYFHSVKKNIT